MIGLERPGEDLWVGEGAGPSGRCRRETREEARSRGTAGQSGPGRTAEHPTYPSTRGDFRKLPRPFVPGRLRSSNFLSLRRENAHAQC